MVVLQRAHHYYTFNAAVCARQGDSKFCIVRYIPLEGSLLVNRKCFISRVSQSSFTTSLSLLGCTTSTSSTYLSQFVIWLLLYVSLETYSNCISLYIAILPTIGVEHCSRKLQNGKVHPDFQKHNFRRKIILIMLI